MGTQTWVSRVQCCQCDSMLSLMCLRLSEAFEGSGLNRGITQVLLSKTKLGSCTMKVQVFIQKKKHESAIKMTYTATYAK